MAQSVLNALALSNINRFSKFFHCQNQDACIQCHRPELTIDRSIRLQITAWRVSHAYTITIMRLHANDGRGYRANYHPWVCLIHSPSTTGHATAKSQWSEPYC